MQELKSSVHKTFAVIEQFTAEKPEWGVTELAAAMGTNKSTIYRFLADLSKLGIVYKDSVTEKYRLGLKLFELGSRVSLQSAFIDKTHPILQEVAADITETVHIAILKTNRVFYVDKVERPQGLKISSNIGSYNPAHCTGLGKVLLSFQDAEEQASILRILQQHPLQAFTPNTITDEVALLMELNRVKSRGYAIDLEEFELGLICVAVPIFNERGELVASLSASGPANRFEAEKVVDYVTTLQKGATKISEAIGSFRP